MEKQYYFGLDIGTNSVGYAVTTPQYTLMKYRGEPMWGVHLFDDANTAAERRTYRTNRRRLDRRQFRLRLLQELFAAEIGRIDPNFFIRRKESALYEEDSRHGVKLFEGGEITDEQYHKQYPTIHHLILDLMKNGQEHDIRLVYMACAWLIANRGHFLFDVPADRVEEIGDFDKTYRDFSDYLSGNEYELPWDATISPQQISRILQMDCGVKKKEEAFRQALFGGGKVDKTATEEFPFNRAAVVTLLSGGKVKPADLFVTKKQIYSELESVSLMSGDEDFIKITSELEETDGELLYHLRAMQDCARLNSTLQDCDFISESKVKIYEQHQQDLKKLKAFVKKYCPEKYHNIFRNGTADNYAAYSKNVKSLTEEEIQKLKFVNKEQFSQFLLKQVRQISVAEEDQTWYNDMLLRLESRTFLPKQREGDNRIIPQQLYRYELKTLLEQAKFYLPLLSQADDDGICVGDKILRIFDFKIPYFVGPLQTANSTNAWLKRKAEGQILPWNLEQMVDLDATEQEFIRRMTNQCSYLPEEDVLPVNALLYQKFMVLNELNNLKVNGVKIPVTLKQEIYCEVFQRYSRVTVKKIVEYLHSRGYCTKQDEISGLDTTVKANLSSYHIFRRMLESGLLTQNDVETIIMHGACCEDGGRFRKWLEQHFPQLDSENIAYILRQKLKGYGRLSSKFLTGVYGSRKDTDTGEAFTIIDALWQTNHNLMQLLSSEYTFAEQISDIRRESYDEKETLTQRLEKMYVSNAVKRPIIRTMDIIDDVVKAMGGAPAKIFIEMARGSGPDQKGKRTKSRKEQLLELYKQTTLDCRSLTEELEKMGEMADNRLQSDRLFLYYLQMGKSAYTGNPIDLAHLSDGTYNLDHIYPQSQVKDDSILNNLVLVESEINGRKRDEYPVSGDIREKMRATWESWRKANLMTEEKFRRLTRNYGFTDDEKMGFINRQLVETRQSTKVIRELLAERFAETEIVCVKAGMVSEYRQEFDLLKCRSINDLHHAKDAYLNVVVGNVYHERFTRKWFSLDSHYNVQVKEIFKKPHFNAGVCYWNGAQSVAAVKKTMQKNAVHLTRYAFCRKGGLFDQQPKKHGPALVPLKRGLDTEKYGGYQKPTASFYALAQFTVRKKQELMLVPIELLVAERFEKDPLFAAEYVRTEICKITGKEPQDLKILRKKVKINTVISLDGMRVTLTGKANFGKQICTSPMMPVILNAKWERYIKGIETFMNKQRINRSIQLDEEHDHISPISNIELYDLLNQKMNGWPFSKRPNNQVDVLTEGSDKFKQLSCSEQVKCLMTMLSLFNAGSGSVDLVAIGGEKKKAVGSAKLSSSLSNWKKSYQDVRIIDQSPSGLFESHSENLLELL